MGLRRRRGAKVSSILPIWAALTTLASAFNFTPVELPDIQTGDYGRMGFIGNFESISLYQYAEQGSQTYFTNDSHAIITQLPNGDLTTLAVANGPINDMCLFTLQDGTVAGVVVGGNFTNVGGVAAQSVALLNATTGVPIPLTGISGSVNALLCDQDSNSVYFGGDFSGANSTNAIIWVGMEGWAELPFQGFNGPVESISRLQNGTVIFGGRFSTIGNDSFVSNPNGTHKITQQVINIQSATVTAVLGSGRAGFDDPETLVCSSGTTEEAGSVFLFEDGQPGSWTAELAYTVYPTKLRLYNTHFEGRGLKTFRFVSRPNNGIMNLTSVDPVSNERFYCDAWCPLSHETNDTVPFQDFDFVNTIPTNAFRLEVIEWFGAGAGLNALELFQDDIYAFADSDLNEPSCKNLDVVSSSEVNGTWTSTGGPPLTDSRYLTATFSGAELEDASVTFKPDIKISGIYQVLIYTPGCLQDGSCAQRGQVTVSGSFSSNETSSPEATYFQTNEFDKYDTLFTGYIEANSEDFSPQVTLRPVAGQEGSINTVASRVRFVLEPEIEEGATTSNAVSRTLGGRLVLNGVFAYNPAAAADSLEQDLAINIAATRLPRNITINSVSVLDKRVFLAGSIETTDFHNFVVVDEADGLQATSLGGLNGIVRDTYLTGQLMYLAGDFNDTVDEETAGLSHVAAYNVDSGEWSALGSGLDGTPAKIVSLPLNISETLETTYVFSGDFTKILATGSAPEVEVDGLAIWVPSKNEWLQRLSDAPYSITGYLADRVEIPNGPSIFGGSLLFTEAGFSGGIGLSNIDNQIQLVPLGVDISIPELSTQTSTRKRAVDSSLGLQLNGVQAGAFDKASNITILGGRFTSGDFENLALIYGDDNNRLSGVSKDVLSGDSVVTSLLVTADPNLLYIGGAINTTVEGAPVGGMIVWDLQANDFVSPQPQPLQADGNDTIVYTITQQPNGRQIYVGGSFTEVAGGFGCAGICVYDPSTFQYFAPGFGFGGTVYASAWTDADTLVVGGELQFNSSSVNLAQYKVSTTAWTVFTNSSEIPGPVTTIFTPVGEENNVYVGGNADGKPFIMRWDGTKWTNLGDALLSGSIVQGIEVFEIGTPHVTNSLLDDNQILMASGNIRLDGYSFNSSAAIFDGTRWAPFVLTTNADGTSGSLGSFISGSKHSFSGSGGKLAVGLVVLISLAIALGLIFLIVVIGVLASYIRRRKEGYVPAPTRVTPVPNPQEMAERLPPEQLFQGVGHTAGRGPPHI
ncbi:hypothetical protein ABW19_dt0201194 [Dactylella cylindrospora]|nr:hypothetical protein ABW19_dt0201194 [Dactylella cylindrospora]